MTNTDVADAERFIGKWKGSAASELSTSQSLLIDLCELLGVDLSRRSAFATGLLGIVGFAA